MAHSYVAFIDESGDDGLGRFRQPGVRGGASTWLIISACIFRSSYSLEAINWRDEICARMPDRKSRQLHFTEMNHGQKVAAAEVIAAKPIRAISVLAAKEPIPEGIYTDRHQLYFYMTRYLIERISWLCRDMRPFVPEGDGRVAITFSRRGRMSYKAFQEYLERLKCSPDPEISIHWPVIDIDAVSAQDHSRSASLQIADTIASAFAAGVEPNLYGNCELRYGEVLKPITYCRKGNYLSYGVKVVPKADGLNLNAEQARFIELFR